MSNTELSFGAWFQQLMSRPYSSSGFEAPNLLALRSNPQVYGSEHIVTSDALGFPRSMWVAPADAIMPDYRLVGFSGFGVSNYSVYWTSVSTCLGVRFEIRLRVLFGGTFCTTDAHRDQVMKRIAQAEQLRALGLTPGRHSRSLAVHVDLEHTRIWHGLPPGADPFFDSLEGKVADKVEGETEEELPKLIAELRSATKLSPE